MKYAGIVGGGKVTGAAIAVDASSPNATIGTGTIEAGQTEVTITNTAVGAASKVFVTAKSKTGGQPLVVTNVTAGTGFTVEIDTTHTADIYFDWWIIN